MIKKIFIFILFIICFLSFKNSVLAIWVPGSEVGDSYGGYTIVADSNCGFGSKQYCNRGSSASDCGTNYGEEECRTTSSGCCSSSPNWQKNVRVCLRYVTGLTFDYITGWGPYASTCSIADKENVGDHRLVRAGNCSCGAKGVYKACCSGGTLINSNVRDDDGKGALEADCPGGTMIWAGGNPIDLNWAQSNCAPACAKGEWYYAGVCDQYQTCSTAPGCGCNGTEITTPRTVSINGTNGSCGAAAGTMHWLTGVGTAPTTTNLITQNPLCADGSSPTVSTNPDFTYTWTCAGGAGTCSGSPGSSASCTAYWLNCNDLNYWAMYPDVKNAGLRPYYHYDNYGKYEGRTWPTSGSTPFCWGGNQISCGTVTAGTPGTNGVCGSSNGQRLPTTPTTGLCTTGGASAVTIGTNSFTWTCPGSAGICGVAGTTASCTAIRDTAPTYVSMIVQNTSGVTVVAEAGGRNQICDTNFSADGTARFVVTFTDIQGGNDINSADLGISDGGYNKTYTTTTFTVSGNNATATFNVPKSDISSTNLLNIYARPYDNHSTITSGAADTGRDFKFWNCNVPTSGRLYDGGASGNCSVPADYITPATATNFKTLDFTDSPTVNMGRVSENEYNGNLTWGKVYTTIFNSVDNDLAMQISGSGVKTTDVSAGTSYCPNSVAFTLNNAVLNPYSASPTLRVDFSGAVDQDSWYQTIGGGLLTNSRMVNRVPVTCTTANCAMSINGTTNTNGIVASPTINNTGNSDVNKGSPNNWWVTKPLVSTSKSDYTYFLNQYFWKSGIGTTLNVGTSMSVIGTNPTGVYFINGDLTINANNSVPVGSFLMMVASGNINVDQSVTNLSGVFVSKNFNVGGSNATVLTINGMIKATENLKISRTFVNKRDNNTAAAVNFVYRPDFVFNIPKEIGKQLVKWQWGN